MRNHLALALLLPLIGTSPAAFATTYSAAGDFSTTSNPTGPWSYGWKGTLLGAFSLDTLSNNYTGIDTWESSTSVSTPTVNHNGTAATIVFASIDWQPGELSLHPSQSGALSAVRFTAPSTSFYDVNASFYGIDQQPTSTDVHVLINGVAVFNALVSSYRGPGQNYATSSLSLTAGDTVDFVVGWGANANYGFDNTGLAATITQVPEPGTLLLVAAGVSGLAWRRRHATA